MDILLWVLAFIWVLGWIKEVSYVYAKAKKHKVEYPHAGVKYAMPVLLFFIWPYFFFTDKN